MGTTMMTDDELNRLVAERVMGWSIYHYDKDYASNCYYMLTDADGDPVAPFAGLHTGERKTEAEAWADVPAYCTNPAAWGALLDWLAGENRGPVLMANFPGVTDWRAEVWAEDDNNRHEAIDILPGRALVLATLKAWGVEVEDD